MTPLEPDYIADRKTTSKLWRAPLLLGWVALFVYFVACMHYSMHKERPAWSYLGGFHMFSTMDRTNYKLDGQALVHGRWEPVDLEAMYPTTWESGHRYQRGPFRRRTSRMRTLAASTCLRHGEKPDAVRFIQTSWKRRLGTTEHPMDNAKTKVLLTWRCGTRWPLPGGRSL